MKPKPKPWRIALVGGYFNGETLRRENLAARMDLATMSPRRGLEAYCYLPIWHDPKKRAAVYAYCSQAKQ